MTCQHSWRIFVGKHLEGLIVAKCPKCKSVVEIHEQMVIVRDGQGQTIGVIDLKEQ